MRKLAFLFALVLCFCTASRAQDSTGRAETPRAQTALDPATAAANAQKAKLRRLARLRAQTIRDSIVRDSLLRAQNAPLTTTAVPPVDSTPNAAPAPNAAPEVPTLSQSDNPFDILRGAPQVDSATAQVAATPVAPTSAAPSILSRQSYSKNFVFWLFLLTLSVMALVVANGRTAIRDAYMSLLTDNALRQTYREKMGWGNFSYLALYFLFWVNAAIFVFLLLNQWNIHIADGQLTTFLLCLAGVSGVFIVKHALLLIVANVFPIGKEIQLYNFIILIAGILLGLILMPLNIFIAYVDVSLSTAFVYITFGVVGLAYLVRSLRGLSVASPFLGDNGFHFLLYLCAIELAPLMILIKLLLKTTP